MHYSKPYDKNYVVVSQNDVVLLVYVYNNYIFIFPHTPKRTFTNVIERITQMFTFICLIKRTNNLVHISSFTK